MTDDAIVTTGDRIVLERRRGISKAFLLFGKVFVRFEMSWTQKRDIRE